jgi:hypothetical protein
MSEADSANGTPPANYRFMLAVVIILGALILIAFGVLAGGMLLGAGREAGIVTDQPYLTVLPAPAAGWLSEAHIDQGQLVVRIDGAGETGGSVVVIDADTGRVIGHVELEADQ